MLEEKILIVDDENKIVEAIKSYLEREGCIVFERFYRVDESRNKLTGGAGIGLTISKSIVEAHKGNIIVESRINRGTEFIVKIPKIV